MSEPDIGKLYKDVMAREARRIADLRSEPAVNSPAGRTITQISTWVNDAGVSLFALCDDGSVWQIGPARELPEWKLRVKPPGAIDHD